MGNVISTTVGGWLAISLLAAGYWYYLQQDQQRKTARVAAKSKDGRHQQPTTTKKEPKETKPKRQRLEDSQRDSYAAKAKSQPAPAAEKSTPVVSYSSDEDNGADNREFARLLNNAKNGTKFASKSKDETRQKTVKQSRAQVNKEPAAAAPISAPSSTAGIDADDDQSSVASPVVTAREAGGVSDMLEAPASGPSILRLTDTEEKKKPQKKTKVPEPVETKKQRQNRKKAEAAKLLREESEKDRKVKQEAQRRTAREAEGRAAKDGSAFMAAQAAASNAWKNDSAKINGAKTNGGGSDSNGFVTVQPLDTFEPSSAADTDASKTSDKNGGAWMSSIPSEEEQMDMLRQETQEDEWSTVKTKPRKAKKKETAAADSTDEATSGDNFSVKPVAQPIKAAPAPQKQAPKPAATRPTKALGQQSSFALLKNEGATEEVEEEWDV